MAALVREDLKSRRLFVYGTLKAGMSNSYRMPKSAKYVNSIRMFGFCMRHCGGYPAIFKTDRTTDSVYGEVYEFPESEVRFIIEDLDRLEGTWAGHYERILVNSATCGDLYVYIQKIPQHTYHLIPDGIWRGSHTSTTTVAVPDGGIPPAHLVMSPTYEQLPRPEQKPAYTPPPAPVYSHPLELMGWTAEKIARPDDTKGV